MICSSEEVARAPTHDLWCALLIGDRETATIVAKATALLGCRIISYHSFFELDVVSLWTSVSSSVIHHGYIGNICHVWRHVYIYILRLLKVPPKSAHIPQFRIIHVVIWQFYLCNHYTNDGQCNVGIYCGRYRFVLAAPNVKVAALIVLASGTLMYARTKTYSVKSIGSRFTETDKILQKIDEDKFISSSGKRDLRSATEGCFDSYIRAMTGW
jgi:hypothetical protein